MMDKFISYSTLKVSLCSGINSIWRTCFFWIRNRKHFWIETWKHPPHSPNIFVQVLDSSYRCPGFRFGPDRKTAIVFYIWTIMAEVITDVPGCCSRISKEESSWSTTRSYPMHPCRLCSYLEASQQLCHERTELFPLFHDFNLHIVHCMVEEYILVWFLWVASLII